MVTSQVQRRSLLAGAAAVAAGAVTAVSPTPTPLTPIMAAAARLKHLCLLKKGRLSREVQERLDAEQCEIAAFLINAPPQSPADAVALLIVAAAETGTNDLYDSGAYGYEHADIIIRRVVRFLADHLGLDLEDCGGLFFLSGAEHEALALRGTVAEAALQFNDITPAEAEDRHDQYQWMFRRSIERERSVAIKGRV